MPATQPAITSGPARQLEPRLGHLVALPMLAISIMTPGPAGGQARVGVVTSVVVIGSDTLAVSRWYPARGEGPRLTVGDYVLHSGCGAPQDASTYATWLGNQLAQPVSADALMPVLSRKLTAARTAPPIPEPPLGRVLILSGRRAEPWYHTTLAERLAAAGLEVLAWSPCRQLDEFDTLTVRRQARLAEGLLAEAAAARGARPTVLLAWSLGGVAAAQLAMGHPDLRGLVSLDAALAYSYGEDLLRAIAFRPAALQMPLLLLQAGRVGAVPRSRWVTDSAGATWRLRARVPNLPHRGFADPYLLWLPGEEADSARPVLETMGGLVTRFVHEAVTGAPLTTTLPSPAWQPE